MDLDPNQLSGAFASIVSLLVEFLSERREAKAQTYNEFRTWLEDNRHSDITKMLENHSQMLTGIKAALSQDRNALLAILRDIDKRLAILASSTVILQPLASAIHPDAHISDDALEFLRDFENSDSTRALEEIFLSEDRMIVPMDGGASSEAFRRPDWRYFEDDIAILIELGLLRLTHNERGNRIFILTRKGSELARATQI